MADVWQPTPPHSLIFGNLEALGDMVQKLPRGIHPHRTLHYIREKYDLPPVFYIDSFPFGWNICAIFDAEVAQQVVIEDPLPKHESIKKILWPIAGFNSLVATDGAEHRRWRNIFNPGFSTAHLMTLVDGIVDDTLVLLHVLGKYADAGEMFYLEHAMTKVTVDIIGRVVL